MKYWPFPDMSELVITETVVSGDINELSFNLSLVLDKNNKLQPKHGSLNVSQYGNGNNNNHGRHPKTIQFKAAAGSSKKNASNNNSNLSKFQ